ncbi:MAG TPA: hypothetical protein VGP81_04860 [Pyrinomonadaceae bacterium]|jgi:LGFP repeat-containing protein|nr:hypothetical protein [Pyrinomonadaceae bacterium]
MSTLILDYTLNTLTLANPDASCPANVTGCAVGTGPGATTLGTFPQALDFGGTGHFTVALPVTSLNRTKFCVRLVFKVDHPVTSRQNLVESTILPFSCYLVPGSGGSDFHLIASVTTDATGTGKASTQYHHTFHLTTWYAVDLVYDTDTLGVFVNDTIYSVHAFPDGTIAAGTGNQLFAGIASNGTSYPFNGSMAKLELHADIPIALESQIDERRAHPQWYLTYKEEAVKSSLAFGEPTLEFYYDLASSSWVQIFPGGVIMYNDANGQAFEMHGAILGAYWSLPNRAVIGYLISDEIDGATGGSRKSLFNQGGIYWSRRTGAIPVTGQIWVDYESMGESGAIGLPRSAAVAVGGGLRQTFERADMYLKAGAAKAFEVNGAILAKYLATGSTATWGFPVSNEGNIMKDSAVIGRISEFERCTIYWSASTGAYEVHGSIRDKYKAVHGPSGDLGFPTSDESDVPGASGARYNTFQHGSIVWFGSAAETYVCMAFDITLGRINTQESEGWLRGQNDVYMHASIEDNGHVIHSERIPSSGDSDGHNIFDVNKTFNLGPNGIVPNSPSRVIRFTLDIWDSDWPDGDDHLGFFDHTLEMANAWGMRGNPSGLFNSGSFDNINSITWSVAPRINEALLTESQRWWGVQNRGTDPLTYAQYASAFRDVDSETEWWDITDWLEKAFYELVIDTLAKNGNCFGMSLESIYSKKHRSILRLPLDRFVDWEPVRNEFNIKHQYQVGASAIWWFVGQFLSGQTHDPVSVFRDTRAAFFSGCDPVLCISQNYDFSGAPHCILPIGWNDSVKPWQILIHDPNFPSMSAGDPGPRILTVDPDANTYFYDGGGNKYSGGEWTGGRMHYMPFDVVNERPRTPIYDAILLLLAGVIVILGSDSETISLTDENGVDLDAFGADSINRLKAGRNLTNKFVSVKGFDQTRDSRNIDYQIRECAQLPSDRPRPEDPKQPRRPRPHGVLPSELYMRSERKQYSRVAPPNKRSGDDWKRLTLKEYLCQLAPAAIRTNFAQPAHANYVAANQGRLLHYLSDDALIKEIIGAAIGDRPPVDPYPPVTKNFIHTTRGLRQGRLRYAVKQGFSELMLMGETVTAEPHRIEVRDLGTHTNTVTVKGTRDKAFNLEIHNKLGAGKDELRISISGIPLTAGGELKMNIKPGLGGVELVSAGQEIKATVRFEYKKSGGEIRSTFPVKEMGGVRVVPSTFITANQLKVNRINNLFGESLDSQLIQPM